MDQNAGADGAAVGLHAFEFHFEPICLAAEVVPQERRGLVQVDDEYVQVAIIIEVAKGTATAAVRGGYSRASGVDEFFKHTLAQISEYRARRFVWVLRKLVFDFGINMTSYYK